jgi:hypothetical protein
MSNLSHPAAGVQHYYLRYARSGLLLLRFFDAARKPVLIFLWKFSLFCSRRGLRFGLRMHARHCCDVARRFADGLRRFHQRAFRIFRHASLSPLSSPRTFTSARIVHGLAAKLGALWPGTLAASGKRSMITLAHVERVIHVPVETSGSAIPGPGAYKNTARKPFRPVITIGSAGVGWSFIVAVRTNRGRSDRDANMRRTAPHGENTNRCKKKTKTYRSPHNR